MDQQVASRRDIREGMKRLGWLGALLVSAVAMGHAQESRQDFSVSAFGVFAPNVNGGVAFPMSTTDTIGVLGSYRYLLTPRAGLELNYGFAQNSIKYNAPSIAQPNDRVKDRQQEISAAFVYSRNYKNFNPFVEAGPGVMVFTPILSTGVTEFGTKQSVEPGGLFGGGVAYEISPSFDIRAEYRGFVLKAPTFGIPGITINKYYVLSTPSIGVAYHF